MFDNNSDYNNEERPDPLGPLYFTVHMVTMVLVYFGNILTIVAVVKYSLLRTVTNTFTVSLSASDLLMAVIMPYCCILNHTALITEPHQRSVACLTCTTFITISQLNSLLNLMAIAVDRYLAVFYSLNYVRIMSQVRAAILVACVWIYTTSFSLFFIWHLNIWNPNTYCSLVRVLPSSIYTGFYVVNILIALSTSIALHVKVAIVARKQVRLIAINTITDNGRPNISRKDAKVTRMTAMVLCAFMCCWTPYMILNIIRGRMARAPQWLDIMYKLSLCVLYSNSFVNPIIYGWKNKLFRLAFISLLSCGKSKNSNSNMRQTSPSRTISKF